MDDDFNAIPEDRDSQLHDVPVQEKEILTHPNGTKDNPIMCKVFSELREIHKICQNFLAGRMRASEAELERYHDIDRGRAFDDILRDIAQIYIDHEHITDTIDDEALRGRVSNILLDIVQVLEIYGVSKQKSIQGSERKLRLTHVTSCSETECPELNGKIAESIRTGFSRGNVPIIKELVKIYRLKD